MDPEMDCAFETEKSDIKLDAIAGLDEAKSTLMKEVAFNEDKETFKSILLYGAPGTGKTYLAKAVASSSSNTAFLSVHSVDLISRWLGSSEQNVKILFSKARESKPCIIFIDEVDLLCTPKLEESLDFIHLVVTEFIAQMQGNENDGLVVLGATSRPWLLDVAIRKQFKSRIYIPLPDCNARTEIFKLSLGDTKHSLTDEDFQCLGQKTDGYCGADINIIVRDALMQPVRKVQKASHFKFMPGPCHDHPNIIVDDLLTPCSPGEHGALEMTWEQVPESKLLEPVVSMTPNPSVNSEDLVKFQKFTNDVGQA